MRELLGNTIKRRLEIVEELSRKGNWVTSIDLSDQLSVSLRTIASDIKYINETGASLFRIETSKKNGIRLIPHRNKQISDGLKLVYQESEAFHFIDHIFFQPDKSCDFWADTFFYSDSTSYRLTNNIAAAFKEFNVSLHLSPCYLYGEKEEQVRQFYSHYFSEAYDQQSWPYPLDRKAVYCLTDELYKATGLYYDDLLSAKAVHIVSVSLIRYQQGFYCHPIDESGSSQNISGKLADVPAILEQFKTLNMPLTPHFFDDFFTSIYFLKAIWQPWTDLAALEQELDGFVTAIAHDFALPIDHKSRQNTCSILAQMYFKYHHFPKVDYVLFDRYAANVLGLEKVFPNYVKRTREQLKKLEGQTQIPWYSEFEDKVLYWLLITWKHLPLLLAERQKTVKFIVLNHLGHGHGHLVASLIEKRFPTKSQTSVYSDPALFNNPSRFATIGDYDYIVTTSMAPHFPPEKTIVTEPIPTPQDWHHIQKTINPH